MRLQFAGAGPCSALPQMLPGIESLTRRIAPRLPAFEPIRYRGLSFMRRYSFLVAAALLAASLPAFATVFATVHGVVHDPQHRPIAGAKITLQAADSDFVLRTTTNADGEFELPQAPIGVYRLTVDGRRLQHADPDHQHRVGHESGAAYSAERGRRDAVGGGAWRAQRGRHRNADRR